MIRGADGEGLMEFGRRSARGRMTREGSGAVGQMQMELNPVDPVSGTRLEFDAPASVETRAESTLLVERAADFLKGGPASSQALVASVCQLSSLPPAIADHMAVTLLRDHPRFVRTADG